MIKISKTLGGVLSTVKDNISLLAADIGKELLPITKVLAERFLDLLKSLRETDNFITTTVKFWGQVFSDTISGGIDKTKKSLEDVKTELEKVDEGIKRVEQSIEKNKDNTIYNSFIGRAEQDMEEFSELLARKAELEQESKDLSADLDAKELDNKKEKAQAELSIEKEKREKALQAKLDARTEEEVLFDEQKAEADEREKEKLIEHEAALEQIKKDTIMNVNEAKRANALDDAKKKRKKKII